ncbi:MAG: PQQ-dependent sugar dehydrogenase [Chloroflexi bacterium]|nr:PQQ-dependent sugar dehydrogenase [Chloroflexota bacterium]
MKRTLIALFFLLTLAACRAADTRAPTQPPPATLATVAASPARATAPPPLPPAATPPPAESPTLTDTPAPASPPDPTCCTLQLIADGLTRPTYLTHGGDSRLFILEQRGLIRLVVDGQLLPTPFLDITSIVDDSANERGLLGLAFHPDYAANGQFFVNFTGAGGDTYIRRYTVSADPNLADSDSGKALLHIAQPYPNHNGGGIVFGPDGLLYIGMGDGGDQGDPQGNGQNPNALLAKLLRLDVNAPNAKPEIVAMGLRNPWRFSFDRATGDLWLGDVGQNQWEEIDFVPAPFPPGLNFGWNLVEGAHPYAASGPVAGLTAPVAEYLHNEGGCSVTGGYVYRGSALPELSGVYLFGDYCSGIIWSLVPDGAGGWQRAVFMETGYNISSFGEDASGELYVIDHNGAVYKLVRR